MQPLFLSYSIISHSAPLGLPMSLGSHCYLKIRFFPDRTVIISLQGPSRGSKKTENQCIKTFTQKAFHTATIVIPNIRQGLMMRSIGLDTLLFSMTQSL